MKARVISYRRNRKYSGWCGNDAWDLVVEVLDGSGTLAAVTGYMCFGAPPLFVSVEDVILQPVEAGAQWSAREGVGHYTASGFEE
jgi:hypothetical protein